MTIGTVRYPSANAVADLRQTFRRLSAMAEKRAADRPDDQVCQWHVESLQTYLDGLWVSHLDTLRHVPISLNKAVFVDFGCHFGQLASVLTALGVERYIGVEGHAGFVEAAREIHAEAELPGEFVFCEHGYVPLPPECADIILMRETVSHVNSAHLDTVFREVARILKPGGTLVISDGNNLDHEPRRETLWRYHEICENGPDGTVWETHGRREKIALCFLTMRKEILRHVMPDLKPDEIDHLAANTSGLFGEKVVQEANKYRVGGFIHRPYQSGWAPTAPYAGGPMSDRGFHPAALELMLREYGLATSQVADWQTSMACLEWPRLVRLCYGREVAIFGTGASADFLCRVLPHRIAYFLDNDPAKQGQDYRGRPVRNPVSTLSESQAGRFILVASARHLEISFQLRAAGLEAGKHFAVACWPGRFFRPFRALAATARQIRRRDGWRGENELFVLVGRRRS